MPNAGFDLCSVSKTWQILQGLGKSKEISVSKWTLQKYMKIPKLLFSVDLIVFYFGLSSTANSYTAKTRKDGLTVSCSLNTRFFFFSFMLLPELYETLKLS